MISSVRSPCVEQEPPSDIPSNCSQKKTKARRKTHIPFSLGARLSDKLIKFAHRCREHGEDERSGPVAFLLGHGCVYLHTRYIRSLDKIFTSAGMRRFVDDGLVMEKKEKWGSLRSIWYGT